MKTESDIKFQIMKRINGLQYIYKEHYECIAESIVKTKGFENLDVKKDVIPLVKECIDLYFGVNDKLRNHELF